MLNLNATLMNLGWGVSIGLLLSLLGAAAGVWAIWWIRSDHFLHACTPNRCAATPPWLKILRNSLGVLLIVAGLAMLVLPGQGLLTIALGLTLLHFPGKERLTCRVLASPAVRRSLNWARRKAGRPPLRFPLQSTPSPSPVIAEEIAADDDETSQPADRGEHALLSHPSKPIHASRSR